MRAIGFALAATMMLYPFEAIWVVQQLRDVIEAERTPLPPSVPATNGMQFDMRTSIVHCGLVGWAGGLAFLLGIVWGFVASALWVHYRLRQRALARTSRLAFVAVLVGVLVVETTYEVIYRVFGMMVL